MCLSSFYDEFAFNRPIHEQTAVIFIQKDKFRICVTIQSQVKSNIRETLVFQNIFDFIWRETT